MKTRGAVDLDVAASDLKAKSLRAGIVTVIFQGLDTVVRLGSIAILARTLTPTDFGLVAMVTALTAIAEQFKDIGLSTATIQRKSISHEQLSKLFWINVITGGLLAALICAAAVPLAAFFGDSRLVLITIAIASGFAWSGAAIQHQALLRRQMRYTALGAVQFTSTLISTAIATGLAFNGHGYWALVWREVLRNVFIAVGTWLVCPWIPGRPRRHIDVRDLVAFGRNVTLFNIIVFLMASVDHILIGRVYGAALLGLYRQAQQLVVWPVMQVTVPLTRVAEPMLSMLQDSPDRYRHAYRRLLTALSLALTPLLLIEIIYAHELVLLVLGPAWIDAAPTFRVLALAMLIRPSSDTTGLLLMTCGNTRRYLHIGIATGLILLTAFTTGVLWGPLGVAWGALGATYVILAIRLRYAFDGTPVDAFAFLRTLRTPALAAAATSVMLLILHGELITSTPLVAVVLAVPVSIGGYVLAFALLPGGRRQLSELTADLATSVGFVRSSRVVKAAFWRAVPWRSL